MAREKRKLPGIVKMAILTVITVIAWIGFEVYRALTLEPPAVVSPKILEPIIPDLDSQSLNKLQKRIHLEESEIGDTTIETIEEESIEATEEGELSE